MSKKNKKYHDYLATLNGMQDATPEAIEKVVSKYYGLKVSKKETLNPLLHSAKQCATFVSTQARRKQLLAKKMEADMELAKKTFRKEVKGATLSFM